MNPYPAAPLHAYRMHNLAMIVRFRQTREPVQLNCALPDLPVLYREKRHKIHMYTKSTIKIRIRKFYPKATKLKPIHLNKTIQLFPMDVGLTLKLVFLPLSSE